MDCTGCLLIQGPVIGFLIFLDPLTEYKATQFPGLDWWKGIAQQYKPEARILAGITFSKPWKLIARHNIGFNSTVPIHPSIKITYLVVKR
jgi:hypothetical protein